MSINDTNGSTPFGGDPNVMKLSEQVDGFIDLEILVDIQKCLNASNSDDDRDLGTWVSANYLHKPLSLFEEKARPIRDAEGFVNLNKAYRRARLLTGKAQDKWPFFNKDLKKLSASVIKSLGGSAVNTARSATSGELRDTPMGNGFDRPLGSVLHAPGSQASPSAHSVGMEQAQKLKSLQPADRRLDQHETEQKPRRQDHSPASKNSIISNTPIVDGTANDTPASTEALQDAGSGKVRGSNGRYVNKDTPTPPSKRKPNIKYVQRSRTRAAPNGESEEIDESSEGEAEHHKRRFRTVPSSPESHNETFRDSDKSPVGTQSASTTSNGPNMSAILAAEAEAVPSNLDRLPPGNTHKKRKSESDIPRNSLKRTRGTRGGLLGRPRKSESLPDRAKLEPSEAEGMQADESVSRSTPNSETPAAVSSRRSSKKSAASAMESATPWDPSEDVLFSSVPQKQHTRECTTTAALSNGTVRATYAAETSKSSGVGQKPKPTAKGAVDAPAPTTTTKSTASQTKAQKKSSPDKQQKRVSFSPETQDNLHNVEFFARITTTVGTQEVPLQREDLTHEVDLVERFAAWQTAGNAPVSFEVFKNIVNFARPS